MNETTWKLNPNLPSGLEDALQQEFHFVWTSASLNLGNKHNWRNLNDDGWYAGLEIGTVSSNDQSGALRTWEVTLWEAGGIMQSVEGSSRWQIHISGI